MSWWLRLPVHESGGIARMLPDFFYSSLAVFAKKKYCTQRRRDAKKRWRNRTENSAHITSVLSLLAVFARNNSLNCANANPCQLPLNTASSNLRS